MAATVDIFNTIPSFAKCIHSSILSTFIFYRPNSFTYFPFGLGHRACIGKHFALVS